MNQTFFFFDDFLLAEYRNVVRRFAQPKFVEEGTFPGGDWLVSVEYLPKEGIYRMWHRKCLAVPDRSPRPDTSLYPVMALAQSEDGIRWVPARLPSTVDKLTSQDPAICFSGVTFCDEFHVFRDPNDPEFPYKTAYVDKDEEGQHRMWLAFSKDGVRWQTPRISWLPTPIWSDTQNHLIYNPVTGRYQITCRRDFVDRRVCLVESADLVEWSEPRVILHPDPLDVPCVEFYGLPVFYYEGIFIGFLLLYFPDMGERAKPAYRGYTVTELVYSYNGLHWNRTRHVLLDRRPLGELGGGQIFGSHLLLDPRTDQLYIYAYGTLHEHGIPGPTGVLLYTLRKDGFVYLESVGEGYICTKPLLLEEPKVSLNLCAPHGQVSIQVSDEEGRPFPNFSFEDFGHWKGDSTDFEPVWGERGLEELVGKTVRFEFRMSEARLYAIRGSLRPFHGSTPLVGYG